MSKRVPLQARRSKRLLGLDPGEARIGVAVSDELGLFAHARPAIGGRHRATALREIAELVSAEDIAHVWVGLPLTLAGGSSAQTKAAREFASELRAVVQVPVSTHDERLTTVQAERGRTSRDRRDGRLDSQAAAILLQSVLDSERED